MTDSIKNEILFNSVEAELARRHAVGETPDNYANKPLITLTTTVKGWWQLYQESQSIMQLKNRSMWSRDVTQPAQSLDTAELVNSLKQIRQLINMSAIGQFRPPARHEEYTVVLLHLITDYYAKFQN